MTESHDTTSSTPVGILHPGEMGASVAAACRVPTLWVQAGRSASTRERAAAAGVAACDSLDELVERCDVVISVCPPHAAPDVASDVRDLGFDGLYVDANAISPATTREIGTRFERFVDGGIIGPPAHGPGTTRLYLAGDEGPRVAALFAGSALEARTVDGEIGAASALKMAYAGWTKGSQALLLAMRAYAGAEGVEADLLAEWDLSQPHLGAQCDRAAAGGAPKAWRWDGEMREIAASLAAVGLPDGFHEAAADVFARLREFRDRTGVETSEVMAALSGFLAEG